MGPYSGIDLGCKGGQSLRGAQGHVKPVQSDEGDNMSRAFVFPGQGAQTIGMGRALAEAYPAARAVFDEVDAALGEKLSALIWDGGIEELTLTQNAQPALMATSMAALRALEAEGLGMDGVAFVAGHSLGEYSALCAAGAPGMADKARLLRIRQLAKQEVATVHGLAERRGRNQMRRQPMQTPRCDIRP